MDRMEYLWNKIKPRQKILKDSLEFQDYNHSVWTKSSHGLSKGCQACKSGTWVCLFVGHKCNQSCAYCPQGTQIDKNLKIDHIDALQHYWTEDIKLAFEMWPKGTISGVSYSGGEPFMYLEKIFDMAGYLTKKFPEIYQWMYTNGTLADENKMKLLFDFGIKEIRFHIGASDFSDICLKNIGLAVKIFDTVNIENPSTPQLKKFLLEQENLKRFEQLGIKQINLAELYLSNDFTKANYEPYPQYMYTSAIRGAHYSPMFSRIITYDIMDFVVQNNIDITINDCSHEARDIQILKKRINPLRNLFFD